MHVIEAEMIMKNDPPVGGGDASRCLPNWIETLCKKVASGDGYTMSHNAVVALCHTLVSARVRTERIAAERDKMAVFLKECRTVLVCADSELSAVGHHRAVDITESMRISGDARKLCDTLKAWLKTNQERSGVDTPEEIG